MTSGSDTNPSPSFWSSLGTEGLNRAPLYLIIGLLFYAPFCFGLREGAGELGFVTLSFVAFFVFCWQRFLANQWPRVPGWLLFCFAIIALQGLWMQLNANSYYLQHGVVHTVRVMDPAPFPNLPGSQNRIETPMQFHPQLAVFCLMIVILNLTASHRRLVLVCGALAAATFALVGLALKLELSFGSGHFIHWFWGLTEERSYKTIFASFRYHGNAATFLAIGLCLNLGLVFESIGRGNPRTRSLAALGSFILMSALIVNTSRAGWALLCIIGLLFGARLLFRLWQNRAQRGSIPRGIVISSVIVLVSGVLFYAFIGADSFRQEKLEKLDFSMQDRVQFTLFAEMWKDTPVFGFGPGAFASVFPKYQILHPGHLSMRWYLNEAHQDFFQLLFDWGVPAFLCWMLVLIRPLLSKQLAEDQRDLGFACQVGGFVVLVHAMMDFPLQVTSLVFYLSVMLACLCSMKKSPGKQTAPK